MDNNQDTFIIFPISVQFNCPLNICGRYQICFHRSINTKNRLCNGKDNEESTFQWTFRNDCKLFNFLPSFSSSLFTKGGL